MTRENICIVGTGYVGLVTGAGLANLGHNIVCVDIDIARIESLQNGHIPFFEKDLPALVHDGIHSDHLHFTTSLSEGLCDTRYVIIAVATPQAETGEPNLNQLYGALDELANLTVNSLRVIVKSTVPIGCFKDLKQRLQKKPGVNYELFEFISCPEFLAEGTAVHDFFFPPRTIVGASNENIAREVGKLFQKIPGPRIYTTPETAQLIKYASNSFLAVRVAFINEIACICEQFGVDVHDVSMGMLFDERLGRGYLRAGIGYGGACLPKDLAALIYTARQTGYQPELCLATAVQNEQQLSHTVEQICKLASEKERVAIFGMAFKAGTSDVRNSLSILVIKRLVECGRIVIVTDPEALDQACSYIESLGAKVEYNPWKAATGSHAQVFLTAWPEYERLDLHRLHQLVASPKIFDGPGIFKPNQAREAGFYYIGIGRIETDTWMIVEE